MLGYSFPVSVHGLWSPIALLQKSGEHRELYITGPSMALRYYNNEKACIEFCYVRAHSDNPGLSTEPMRPLLTGESSPVGSWCFWYQCDSTDGSILAMRWCLITRRNFLCLIMSKLINPSLSSVLPLHKEAMTQDVIEESPRLKLPNAQVESHRGEEYSHGSTYT